MPTAEEKAQGLDARSRRHDVAIERSTLSVKVLDRVSQGETYGGVAVEALKFKLSGQPMGESLAIITGTAEDGTPIVAFHTAVGFPELFHGLVARLMNGTLKWRTDEYRS